MALDVSGEMLRRARAPAEDLANVDWIHGDGASLAATDGHMVVERTVGESTQFCLVLLRR